MKDNILKITFLLLIILTLSCKKFLEIDPPKSSLVQETILSNNDVATSAVLGIYSSMATSGYASGSATSITALAGLSADELVSYSVALNEFYQNQLTPLTANIGSPLYANPYKSIFTANSILEGLSNPNGVTSSTKGQLQGECLFIRAFAYFNLVNLYGPVPLQLSSDYRVTSIASRSSVQQIYQQIISDLKSAETLLTDNYVTTERVRPNLAAVQALLARTYLYTADWVNAEKYASLVIGKTNLYSLAALDGVFLKNSSETIWQLFPTANSNASDGNLFILTASPTNVALNPALLNVFENNDKRKTSWIRSFTNTTGTYYYAFKYKTKSATTPVEYSMILRLAEQYLIRSEARAQLNNLLGSIDDLDAIRLRAGISLVKNINAGINQKDLLAAIQKERRLELFTEWGHRWFDLKRTNTADNVLSATKPNWQTTDLLYPIPQPEINLNHNITQNDGY